MGGIVPVPSKQMSRIMRGLFWNFDSDSTQIMSTAYFDSHNMIPISKLGAALPGLGITSFCVSSKNTPSCH